MERTTYDSLDPDDRELLDAARGAIDTAYAPYSDVRVGAALRTPGGVVTASNVENGAFGSTLCAERMAVGRANARGERSYSVVAVAARSDRLPAARPVTPCGPCRQVLLEMARATGTRTRLLMAAPGTDDVLVADLDELLPEPFEPLDP